MKNDYIEYLTPTEIFFNFKEVPGYFITLNLDTEDLENEKEIYFKFYKGSHWKDAEWVARISFYEPKYIEKDIGIVPPGCLNNDEKEKLILLLNSRDATHFGKIWDRLKTCFNEFFEFINDEQYFSGKLDEKYKEKSWYLPSTLEIPDYTKLK